MHERVLDLRPSKSSVGIDLNRSSDLPKDQGEPSFAKRRKTGGKLRDGSFSAKA